uniref:Uncharacterized protein n=1 Tax=viral metagenome TaxID=1070528 RepID=A0A6C0ESI0_9ZZZZ
MSYIEKLEEYYESLKIAKIKKLKRKKPTKYEPILLDIERIHFQYNKDYLNDIEKKIIELKRSFLILKYDVLYQLSDKMDDYDSLEQKIKDLEGERDKLVVKIKLKRERKNQEVDTLNATIEEKMMLYKDAELDDKKQIYIDINEIKKQINSIINQYSCITNIKSSYGDDETQNIKIYNTLIKDYCPIFNNEINLTKRLNVKVIINAEELI